jgi:hypothetical protein
MTNLQRRLKKLEARSDPRGPLRLVVRYPDDDFQGPDDERESDADENDPNTFVVVVEYVDMPSKAPPQPAREQPDLPLE